VKNEHNGDNRTGCDLGQRKEATEVKHLCPDRGCRRRFLDSDGPDAPGQARDAAAPGTRLYRGLHLGATTIAKHYVLPALAEAVSISIESVGIRS
jgi:hypothetical protein